MTARTAFVQRANYVQPAVLDDAQPGTTTRVTACPRGTFAPRVGSRPNRRPARICTAYGGRRVARPGTLSRRVLFYEVFRDGQRVRSRRDFDFAEVFGGIGRLPNTLAGRRDRESEEAYISCIVDSANTVRFGRIRRRGLPSRIDDGDNIDNIPLARNGGLFEATHVMYFEPGIIGAEFNFYAPRVSRLAPYIRRKAGVAGLEIVPIIKGDAARDLGRLDRLKKFTMKVATDAFDSAVNRRRFRSSAV
jgi:hypothetical protein